MKTFIVSVDFEGAIALLRAKDINDAYLEYAKLSNQTVDDVLSEINKDFISIFEKDISNTTWL